MAYSYQLLTDEVERAQGIRAILGVDEEELPLADIDQLFAGPAAELEVLGRLTGWETLLEVTAIKLAVMYYAAGYLLPAVKNKVLSLESDNRSTASRLKSAFDKDPSYYFGLGSKYVEQVANQLSAQASSSKTLFTVVPPARDEITGA